MLKSPAPRFSFLSLLLMLFLAPAMLPAQAADPPVRQRILMDAGWRFQYDTASVLAHAAAVTDWRVRTGEPGDAPAMTAKNLDTSGPDWSDAPIGKDTFNGRIGFNWYVATLPALNNPHRVLRFASVDDNATVYLNGKQLAHHEGWNDPFDVPLDAAWNPAGPNIVAVLVQNTGGGGGISSLVALGTMAPVAAAADPSRPDTDDTKWRIVHLPHDYVLESPFDPKANASHGSLVPRAAWYRKTFTLPAADKFRSVWLDFDGVYRDSIVYLNGVKLGEHPCGYTPFRYDISRAAHFGGRNVLAVQVNAQKQEGWWYEGGGIYRHVWLNVAAPVHIAPWGTFVTAKLPEPGPDGVPAPATLIIKTTVDKPNGVSANGHADYRLVSRILDPAGRLVGAATTSIAFLPGDAALTQQVTVPKPLLWSIETPRLYRLHTEIRNGPQVIDATDTPFGIRTLRFDADEGFFLNGKPVKLKGTCNHQDFAGVGVAMPDSLLYWRIKKLKEMGSNAYRCSHNPPTAELLDACDKLGMVVMDENRHLGDTEDGKASQTTPYADLHEVQTMILRDRNHPSVIMWSMCNEEGIQGSPHGRDIFAAMKRVVDAADGTRPVTCAMNGGYDSPDGISSVEDLQGINYNPSAYDRFHKAHPTLPLYGSETASEVGTRGIYDTQIFHSGGRDYQGDQVKGYVSAYDVNAPSWAQTAEAAWSAIAGRPFVAGGFVWTGFDYKGEPTPFGWPCINSHFGIMDECGFPKDTYYYYQAVWGDQPVVHVFPHWNWAGQEGQPIDVWVFSNAARVELFLNGASLGAKEMPRNGHLSWPVPYAPGTLEAKAFTDNALVASDTVETTGPPARLRLTTDRTTLTADGEDVTMVAVDVVDAQGRVVPTADNEVTFAVSGAAHVAGVGNGDPSSHEPDKASRRHAFNGRCMVIVGAGETPGPIRLAASAPGLKADTLALVSQSR